MKKWPFKSTFTVIDYSHQGADMLPKVVEQELTDCIWKECMAWKGGPDDEHIPYVYNFCELTKGH
jgi:hypothetical protein